MIVALGLGLRDSANKPGKCLEFHFVPGKHGIMPPPSVMHW